MLFTLTTTRSPATDLGFLLGKHPDRFQTFEVSGGKAHVFYPEAKSEQCTAALLLDLDPVTLTRQTGEKINEFALQPYVNDRPYVASSWLATALAKVFSSAMNGKCRDYPDMPDEAWPWRVFISAIAGSDELITRLFEPLGYRVEIERPPLDSDFPEWGLSRYAALRLEGVCRLSDLLTQLYVLIPILDADKHYYIAGGEEAKLAEKGQEWLDAHPEKDLIVRRYLRRQSLIRQFAERAPSESEVDTQTTQPREAALEPEMRLHELRLRKAYEQIKTSGARSVLDLGCGEGKLLRLLADDRSFNRITGVDVSPYSLAIAQKRLKLQIISDQRIQLFQGSATYRDERMKKHDAVALVEVIEHLDAHALPVLEQVVFGYIHPQTVVVTTPRADYNQKFDNLTPGVFRHSDHRFEWTEAEFQAWANRIAEERGYLVQFYAVGENFAPFGAPSQMAVFQVDTTQTT